LKQSFDPKPAILPARSGLLNNASLAESAGTIMNPLLKTSLTTTPSVNESQSGATTTSIPKSALRALEKQIQAALTKAGLEADASLQLTTRGLVVQVLADRVFFATGSADISPVGNQVIDTVSSVLRSDTYDIDIEGYTDNQPVEGGVYSSNEELSAVRAVNVVLRLEKTDGINPNRLSATGYGDTHPVAPNTTPHNMALNRRIDIVILSSQQAQP
jgi:chemotaxis protein MotB